MASTLACMLRTVEIARYVTPLREGSSLPALVEADDGAEYVIKFRGAGHGVKALIAELLVGEVDVQMLRQRELLRRLDVVGLRFGEAADALADGSLKRHR